MNKIKPLAFWNSGRVRVDPVFLLRSFEKEQGPADAALFWGKASIRTWEALGYRSNVFGICSEVLPRPRLPGRWMEGEHPLPGKGSFRAGRGLLDFFDSLRRNRVRRLNVFLSGGASSLAWLPKPGISEERLAMRLERLYSAGLDIHELNARRAKLCQLKAGGAARWLARLAPDVRTRVFVLSDVAPYGPEVVGSGPFWDGKIPHRVLADNTTLVRALATEARRQGLPLLQSSSACLGSWQSWVQTATRLAENALRADRRGIIIWGGEPSLRHPRGATGRGGRQTHLAAALALELFAWIEQGRVEILAVSSDGSDGKSGAAGALIDRRLTIVADIRRKLRSSGWDSAGVLGRSGALIPADSPYPLTNVQDVLMIFLGKRLA